MPSSKPQPDGTLVKALHNPANESVECEAMGHPPGPGVDQIGGRGTFLLRDGFASGNQPHRSTAPSRPERVL